MDLKFSIIVPVYNRPTELDELLDSISRQDYQYDFEIIVVEDGSDISSEEIVEKVSRSTADQLFF